MTKVCLAVDQDVRDAAAMVILGGGSVHADWTAGTVSGHDPDGNKVYMAIRKGGKGQPWIVRCTDSPRFNWRNSDGG